MRSYNLFIVVLIALLLALSACGSDRDSSSGNSVSTANNIPVANAGEDQNVTTGSIVTLDGNSSSDADNDPLTYSWSFTLSPAGSSASFNDATVVNPTFTADADGIYILTLIVNDGTDNSIVDSVTITAATNSVMLALPDTGQTTCSGTTGAIINCDGTGQDGEYTINPPSYADNGDGTVSDNVTGLVWQQTDDDTTRARDVADSYCANLSLGGYSNWRLPTLRELVSIVNYGKHSPTIDSVYFPGTNSSYYWSSTPYARYPSNTWYVDFYDGYVDYYSTNPSYYVRCVR